MKLLVSIPDFLGNQMQYLNTVIDEYKSFKKYDTTINVHTTVDIPRNDVNIIKHEKSVGRLAYVHRSEFIEARNDYDLYIFTENDMLVKEEAVDTFLKYQSMLPETHCLGFIRYEQRPIDDPNDTNLYLFDVWPNDVRGHLVDRDIEINNNHYFTLKNPFQSCFLLTRGQLNHVIDNCGFDRTDWAGIETSSAGVYKNWEHGDGVINKVWTRNVEDLKKCLIHHLPNLHCDSPHKYGPNYHTQSATFNSLLKDLKL